MQRGALTRHNRNNLSGLFSTKVKSSKILYVQGQAKFNNLSGPFVSISLIIHLYVQVYVCSEVQLEEYENAVFSRLRSGTNEQVSHLYEACEFYAYNILLSVLQLCNVDYDNNGPFIGTSSEDIL